MVLFMSYERPNISALFAYVPGEQPQDRRVVKLNTNENPYPPSPAVMAAIRDVDAEHLRRYPPPAASTFRQAAARVHGLGAGQVIATNGGDELLRLAVTVYCDPAGAGAAVGVAKPSYSLYPVLAQIHGVPLVSVPLRPDFGLPPDFADRVTDAGCRLVMIVNPHAPSGRLEPLASVEALAKRLRGRAVLLVDEAYVDFADADVLSLLRSPDGPDNVLVLRSLSKGYSLAGLRFGYGLGHPQLIQALDKARDSYNTDVLGQAAAAAALGDIPSATLTWRAVIDQRTHLTQQLGRRGFEVLPSQANFILVRPTAAADRADAATLYQALKQRSILVRYFNQDMLRDRLRITIGTPEQNSALLAALDEIERE